MRVFVTGAAGGIGRALLERLAGRVEVVALAFDEREEQCLRRFQPSAVVRGDLRALDDGVVGPALAACDAVVHLAALVHSPAASSADYHEVNVVGTRRLVELYGRSRRAGPRHVVLVSTVAVFGPGREGPYTEVDEPRPHTPYAASKLEAERAVLAAAAGNPALRTTILRPVTVYGVAGDRGNVGRMLRFIGRWHAWPVVGDGANRKGLIHVDDVARAIEASLTDPRALDRVFVVAGGDDPSMTELLAAIRQVLGLRVAAVRVPRAAAALLPPLRKLAETTRYDGSQIRAALGLQPLPLVEGLALMRGRR